MLRPGTFHTTPRLVIPVFDSPRLEFIRSADLDVIRYSQVWEDHVLLERGLDVGPEDDVLSIGSAGCNVLALLLAGARSVVAVDASPAQSALIELKLAGLKTLSHREFVELVGVRHGADRLSLYGRLRPALSPATRAFWDERPEVINSGVVASGKLERYFRDFRDRYTRRLIDPAAIRELLTLADPRRQAELFERHIAIPDFEDALRAHFTVEAMAGPARDESQFRYVEMDDVGGHFMGRLRHVCTAVPARGNFYLEWFLTGSYRSLELGPPYLRRANFDRLRSLVDRVEVVQADLESFLESQPSGAFSKANLSDVFEYMPEDAAGELLELVASRLRPGGRVAHWDLLVPRPMPAHLGDRLAPLRADSARLHNGDRVPFYRDFHLHERP